MITRPVRERNIETIGAMVAAGPEATGLEEVGFLLEACRADHSEIADVTKQLADRYEGRTCRRCRRRAWTRSSTWRTSCRGKVAWATFAPEGGSERLRRVINKMVSEDRSHPDGRDGVRQRLVPVKLYFMCGLPTETDEDVLAIAEMAKRVIATGREVAGTRDIRCTVSIGGFGPEGTPCSRAAGLPEVIDARLLKLRDAIRADRQYGKAIGFRYHDGKPGQIEGLPSRGASALGSGARGRPGGTGARSTGGASTSATSGGCAVPRRSWSRWGRPRKVVHDARA